MNDAQILGWLLIAFGVWIAATSRGAFDWWSNAWRVSDNASESWIAMVMGPRLVITLHLILGIVCILGGVLLALRS